MSGFYSGTLQSKVLVETDRVPVDADFDAGAASPGVYPFCPAAAPAGPCLTLVNSG